MKAELTESKLQVAMKEYLEVTPDAVILGGLIWTSPERVRRFVAGLGKALADVIYAVIAPPVADAPLEASEAGVVEVAEVLLKAK